MKKKINNISNYFNSHETSFLLVLTIVIELFFYIITPFIKNCYEIVIGVLFISISLILIKFGNKKSASKVLFRIIYILGILIRINYILGTDIDIRQHDVGGIYDEGHLAYIYILFTTHRLPTSLGWQFYHPPLWHTIGALWLEINNFFNIKPSLMLEGIQLISCLFSVLIIIIGDKICQKLKMKDRYRYLVDFMLAIHPTLIIFSGSINNDCLLLFMETLVILLLINWNEFPSTKNIIYLAIVTGLCVLTKANGAIMAMPILYIFIKKFMINIQKKDYKILNYIKKICLFGIISLPIGLWYQVRNVIKFANIAIPMPGDFLYNGEYSIIKRFFSINFQELFRFADTSVDYNLPTFILKSSVWGEYNFSDIKLLAYIVLGINLILIIISMIFIIKYLLKKKKNDIINILIITWITSLVMMYIFNYKYPFGCSMDFRYIAICLLPGIIIMVNELNNFKINKLKIVIEGLCYLFVIVSLGFIILI